MSFRELKIIFSILLFLFITASAWPAYVLCSVAVSHFTDMLGVLDFIDARPKKILLSEFLDGWKQSLPLACALGLLAVIDMQLLIRNRFTYFLAGISLPIALTAITLVFFKNYGLELAPTFALTGVVLWFIYRILELFSRLERG